MSEHYQLVSRNIGRRTAFSLVTATGLGLSILGCADQINGIPQHPTSTSQPSPSPSPSPPTPTPSPPPSPQPTPQPVVGTASLELRLSTLDMQVPQTGSVAPPLTQGTVFAAATTPGDPVVTRAPQRGEVILVARGTTVHDMSTSVAIARGSIDTAGRIQFTNIPTTDQGTAYSAFFDTDGDGRPDGRKDIELFNNDNDVDEIISTPGPVNHALHIAVDTDNRSYRVGDQLTFLFRGENVTGSDVPATIELLDPQSGSIFETRNVVLGQGTFDEQELFSSTALSANTNYAFRLRPEITTQEMMLENDGHLEVEVRQRSPLACRLSLITPRNYFICDADQPECVNERIGISRNFKQGTPINFQIEVTDGATTRQVASRGPGYTGTDASGSQVTNAQFAHIEKLGPDEWYIRMSVQDGPNTDFSQLPTAGDIEFVCRRQEGSSPGQTKRKEYLVTFSTTDAPQGTDRHDPLLRITRQRNRGDSEEVRVGPNRWENFCQRRNIDNLLIGGAAYEAFVASRDKNPQSPQFVVSGLERVDIDTSTDGGTNYTPLTTLTADPQTQEIATQVSLNLPAGRNIVRFTAYDNAGNTTVRTRRVNVCENTINDLAMIRSELLSWDAAENGGNAFFGGAALLDNPGRLQNLGGSGYCEVLVDGRGLYDPISEVVYVTGPQDIGSLIRAYDLPDTGDGETPGEDRVTTDDAHSTTPPTRLFIRFRPATAAERSARPTGPGYDPEQVGVSVYHTMRWLQSTGRY
ncbi:hypothetical protein GF342_04630 [Candidatus Woesearchaeota archaeon]|nr:hypothetical protein [Candidatus Woesearchaeota archaeon]